MYLQHPDLAVQHAQQRVASLLEETEHDRQASRARAASAARRAAPPPVPDGQDPATAARARAR